MLLERGADPVGGPGDQTSGRCPFVAAVLKPHPNQIQNLQVSWLHWSPSPQVGWVMPHGSCPIWKSLKSMLISPLRSIVLRW